MSNTTSPAEFTLELFQGATYSAVFYILNAAGTTALVTGCQAELTVSANGETVVALTSSPAAGLTVTVSTGKVAVVITDEQTEAMDFGRGDWNLDILYADGTVTRALLGEATLTARA